MSESKREGDMRRMHFPAEESSLLLKDYRSGGAVITGAPSSWCWRRLNGGDAGCMLIKQNTNWKDRNEKTRPPFQLQPPPSPFPFLPFPLSLQETRVWWALIRQWLARLFTELHRLSDFKAVCLIVCLPEMKHITRTAYNYCWMVICIM